MGLPKIGIGITCCGRPEVEAQTILMISRFLVSAYNYKIVITHDVPPFKGVARSKNYCLYHLKNCDFIFLFDDDCFPIRPGWIERILITAEISGENHFTYCDPARDNISGSKRYGKKHVAINSCHRAGAPFMFLTKKVIETVGGFYIGYDRYGFEHVGYSRRIYAAGLTSNVLVMPEDLSEFLCSRDYEDPNFQSSISQAEKQRYIDDNRKILDNDDIEIYRSLLFD